MFFTIIFLVIVALLLCAIAVRPVYNKIRTARQVQFGQKKIVGIRHSIAAIALATVVSGCQTTAVTKATSHGPVASVAVTLLTTSPIEVTVRVDIDILGSYDWYPNVEFYAVPVAGGNPIRLGARACEIPTREQRRCVIPFTDRLSKGGYRIMANAYRNHHASSNGTTNSYFIVDRP